MAAPREKSRLASEGAFQGKRCTTTKEETTVSKPRPPPSSVKKPAFRTLCEWDPGLAPTGPTSSPSSDTPAQIHHPHLCSYVPDQRPGSPFCGKAHSPPAAGCLRQRPQHCGAPAEPSDLREPGEKFKPERVFPSLFKFRDSKHLRSQPSLRNQKTFRCGHRQLCQDQNLTAHHQALSKPARSNVSHGANSQLSFIVCHRGYKTSKL